MRSFTQHTHRPPPGSPVAGHTPGRLCWLPCILWQTQLCLICLSNFSSWNRFLNAKELVECVKIRRMLYEGRKGEILAGPLGRKLLETNEKLSLPTHLLP